MIPSCLSAEKIAGFREKNGRRHEREREGGEKGGIEKERVTEGFEEPIPTLLLDFYHTPSIFLLSHIQTHTFVSSKPPTDGFETLTAASKLTRSVSAVRI